MAIRSARRLTYGSSGGPVLDASGDVIALNYALLDNFAGAKFGIPIRFVHELLRAERIGRRESSKKGE